MKEGEDIPPDIRSLLVQRIDSVVQLELLLLLHANATRVWRAEEIARELRIDSTASQEQLGLLVERGLVQKVEEVEGAYQYRPTSQEVEQVVDGLAKAYANRRVTVISLIYSRPTDTLRSFSDAFRLFRKEKDDG